MDLNARQRELFFNNLLILEFDKSAVEKDYRVKCDKDMFSVPNQQMFEIVTYFLFEKLSELSEKEYNFSWPLIDREHHRQFLKTSISYISSIAQESDIKFPRVVPSVISTFGGDRFYELYLALSSHVVEKTIRRNNNVSLILRPSVTKHSVQDTIETLKIATLLSGEKFQEIQHFSLKSFEFSLKTSNNFITCIQKLRSNLASNSSLLLEKNTFLESLFFSESDKNGKSLQYSIEQIFEHTNKVKKYWKKFQHFLEKEKMFWDYLFPVIKENPEMLLLDGANLNLDVNDSVKELSPELNQICSTKMQDEKVCMLKYLKVFSMFLKLYEKMLLKGDLLRIKELSNVQKTWSFESNLKELKTLHEKLLTSVFDMKENNKVLQDRLFVEEVSEDLQNFTKECISWNFSSKSFQDEINTSRLIFTDKITGDILKTSLFTNDSGLESGTSKMEGDASCFSLADSSSGKQNTFCHERILDASTVKPKPHFLITASDDFDSFDKTLPTNILNTLKKEKQKAKNTPVPNLVHPSRTHKEETVFTQPLSHTPGLVFDIDIDFHKTREIRKSWFSEEDLDSVTLPETSFLD